MATAAVLPSTIPMASTKEVQMETYTEEGPSRPDAANSSNEDYDQLKALERQLEFISIQEEYLKDEMRNLNR